LRSGTLLHKNKALPSCPRRFAACAVKAAEFAFIGAK